MYTALYTLDALVISLSCGLFIQRMFSVRRSLEDKPQSGYQFFNNHEGLRYLFLVGSKFTVFSQMVKILTTFGLVSNYWSQLIQFVGTFQPPCQYF